MSKKTTVSWGSGLTAFFLITGTIIAANFVVGQIGFLRADLTEEKLYTLSDGTRELIQSLEQDVTLKFYYSRSLDNVPMPLKQYAQQVQDMLREYERHSKHIHLEVFDPKPDSEEEEWAQKFGVQGNPLEAYGYPFYLGLVATRGTKDAALPFLNPADQPELEYSITRLIYEVSRDTLPTLGILSTLDVIGAPTLPYTPPQGSQKWLIVQEFDRLYDVRKINEETETISEEIETLMVIHPRGLSEKTLYAIDQFVMRGGRLIAYVDPRSVVDAGRAPRQFSPPAKSDLNRITEAWGVTLAENTIAADRKQATQLNDGRGGVELNPGWPSLHDESINSEDLATGPLESIMLPFPGHFSITPTNDIRVTTLLQTSDDSGYFDVNLLDTMDTQNISSGLTEVPQLPLAVRLQGTFSSAFTNAPAGSTNIPPHLASSSNETIVVLVADVDVLHDRFCIRRMPGGMGGMKLNDNLNLSANLVEQLTGDTALIDLRSRGRFERPFTKVIELERVAQQKWQVEEQALMDKIAATEQRILALQQGKSEDQQFIMSPEQREELEKLQEEEFETNKRLKEVRKNLRSEIERLGLNLKMINIAAVPLLVIFFGLTRGFLRKQKSNL